MPSFRPRSALATSLTLAALLTSSASALAQEKPECLSSDPSKWPASSKPYFMLIVDTSGSMTATVSGTNSCGYSNNRLGHARCAVQNTLKAFSGAVNFGLASYAWRNRCSQNPDVACSSSATCSPQYAAGDNNSCGPFINEPNLGVNVHSGAHIVVPMLQDHYWQQPPDPSNVPTLLQMVDNRCGTNNGVDNDTNPGGAFNSELGASSNTPLGGSLFDIRRYLSGTYVDKFTGATLPTPIGTAAQGERPCRSINIILLTDGDETCDSGVSPTPIAGGCRAGFGGYLNSAGERLASYEADRMFTTGISVGGQTFKVKTHVIGFAGADINALNNVAKCGGTGTSYSTSNETQLSQALANIVGGAITPETCDNKDNNCNGCTDEGFQHYCSQPTNIGACCSWKTLVQRTACGANACGCCNWSSDAERTSCLGLYTASITAANPSGDTALLPCTTAAQKDQPSTWLCYNPGDVCDEKDNNCNTQIDEQQIKCGTPLHCPATETCNGQDDDCDGTTDEGCPGICNASPEVCDGCDNDCNGVADDSSAQATIPCGPNNQNPAIEAPNCIGTITCKAPQNVAPGTCTAGGGFNACNITPQTETCDAKDNDCDGIVDNNVPPVDCVPAGTPGTLVYGGTSQCKKGKTSCSNGVTSCVGFVGPSASEVCDGIDNDCDGQVDEGASGTGQQCGINQPPCTPGVTACVAGALVCQGGQQPQPETCDGIDNNCNGQTDEAPLVDGPAPGAGGCWDIAGSSCSFGSLKWNAPPGATCNDAGTLTSPCKAGSLTCSAGAWKCLGATKPSAEVCDGIDNNCNGATDDNAASVGAPCGTSTGACEPGVQVCQNGQLFCSGGVQATVETCNGLDDDCDGVVDDNIQGLGQPCGVNQPPCTTGVTACVNGAIACTGGIQPQAEVCDGKDNDCDGSVDEAPLADGPAPGQGGCWTTPGSSCTFNSLKWGPPAGATCNDVGTLTSPCKTGSLTCSAGAWKCLGAAQPSAEVCDNVDNNCNGKADDGIPGVGQACGSSVGACEPGVQVCQNGQLFCSGNTQPTVETCNGIDDDCDGVVDDNIQGLGQPCGVNQPPCTTGITACVNGAIACTGGIQPQPEVCDGKDNNCNGAIDEAPLADGPAPGEGGCWTLPGSTCTFDDLKWNAPPGATCNGIGTLTSPCKTGSLTCSAGTWKCFGAAQPSTEVCDNVDNNCNGTIDDGIPGVGQACGINQGACKQGTQVCQNGQLFCSGNTQPTVETCNGIDDDCDGVVDDGIQGLGQPCGANKPPCTTGVTACQGGQIVCSGGVQPQPELCDGVDNNCNGLIDEAPLADSPGPGKTGCWTLPGDCCTFDDLKWCPPPGGNCNDVGSLTAPCSAGTLSCVSGAWACNNQVTPEPEVCDSKDNNCDGAVDNAGTQDCVPPNTDPNLIYGGTSQCKMGSSGCGVCAGFVGPSDEVCDGIDNDCDGVVDEDPKGVGQQCGFNVPPCTPGVTACVNGKLECTGGVQPQPEQCDGVDNNCNGTIDEAPLVDAPAQDQIGCWAEPGECCTYKNAKWCPPQGADCTGNGTLAAPCNRGFLACGGKDGWVCKNAKVPAAEVCDGIDNDCNGTIDDGTLPNTGGPCGETKGACKEGTLACKNGIISCDGAIGPKQETCNGIDDNCNGAVDDGIVTGGTCSPPYDTEKFPGNRTQGACQPGTASCDGQGGLVCVGGIGPVAEVCDGIDNDCDGLVDEVGPAPDGIDGTANPTGTPAANIGDACGESEGSCTTGSWACLNGIFQCNGATTAQPEACDCLDNNCDGKVDNPGGPGDPPLCGSGKQCVKSDNSCLCAAPCAAGEFPCPTGQVCRTVTSSATGESLGEFCVVGTDPCADCASKTVKDAEGKIVCGPKGTDKPGCVGTPECVCKGDSCQEPCFNVTCPSGKVCAQFGPSAGQCVVDSCFVTGCPGCGKFCHQGSCAENPCLAEGGTKCAADEVCKPKADLSGVDCIKSCAGVVCNEGEVCKDGVCEATCQPACEGTKVCDPATKQCVDSKCPESGCANGGVCDPLTGECGSGPCEGVVCPLGQTCDKGQCQLAGTGGAGGEGGAGGQSGEAGASGEGGAGGQGNQGGVAGASGAAGKSGASGASATPGNQEKGVIGLATGGGGCACRVVPAEQARVGHGAAALLAALGAAVLRRRARGQKEVAS